MFAFGLYIRTLCPTVYWDDAGELIAACYTLGIPHPPGHPLYAIIGKLFTFIPIGSPAYGVNLMSAFFGALTCALVFQIVRELAAQKNELRRFANFGGLLAACFSMVSLLLWDQSTVAETTTLHSFFMMLVTLLAFRIYFGGPTDPRLTRRLLVFGFVYGLSFTNHVAGTFFAPSIALILAAGLKTELFRPRRLAGVIVLFALALLVYLYLPVRSRFDPAIDWGNPETLENFLWVVTAKQYSRNILRLPTFAAFIQGLHNMTSTFVSNMTVPGCLLGIGGAVALWRERKPVVIYGSLVILILFLISLNSAFISVYLLPAVLLLAIWAGYGVAALCAKADAMASAVAAARKARLTYLIHAASLIYVSALLVSNFSERDRSPHVYAKDYGERLLSSLPHNAVLITGTADTLFISWYLQYCENYRTDVKVITRNGLTRPGYLQQIRDLYPELNIPREFEYVSDEGVVPSHIHDRGTGLPWFVNSYFKRFYDLNSPDFVIFWEGLEPNQLLAKHFVPHDLVFRVLSKGEKAPEKPLLIESADEIIETINADPAAGKVYGNHMFNYALYNQWRHNIPETERYYHQALKLFPNDSRTLNNLGALLAQQGRMEEAAEKFLQAFRLNVNDPAANHNVGRILLEKGEFERAIPYFQRSIHFDPDNFEDYHNLGLCYAARGKNKRALRMLQKALELNPESPHALSSLGVLHLRMKETKNAEACLKAAVRLEPDSAENWYNLACMQALEGDTAGSSESLRKALSLDFKRTCDLASKDSKVAPILSSLLKNP